MKEKIEKKTVYVHKCGVCGDSEGGEIHSTLTMYEDCVKLSIDKCNNCKHQYYSRDILKLEKLRTIPIIRNFNPTQ